MLFENIIFFKMFWKDHLSKKIALESDLSYIVRRYFFYIFPENMILFFRQKMKDDLSQKIRGNMIFSLFSVKMIFVFPTNIILHFCQKSKDVLFRKKKQLKVIFPVLLKKMIFILENIVFLLIEKLKMIKTFIFMKKFQWFSLMETIIGVFIYCFPMKKLRKSFLH